ncbi:hypothetical protein N0V88_007941 [Collariella sp. IMI 366227]|nr:hypothetical protein N0V88_007941 [Collariella sp. IMI 366227]
MTTSNGNIVNGPFSSDLHGSNFTYPWPIQLYNFTFQGQTLGMAYMDVPAERGYRYEYGKRPSAAKTAVLLHGKNFCAATWAQTATVLSSAGYRVIIPDQVGFCKSSKPQTYQFTLHQLALNTRNLLTTLGVRDSDNLTVIGHSFGGMLATRFALMYPDLVSNLVLANPIGLEDWKALGVPYIAIDETARTERASTYASIRAYEQTTYYAGTWAPEYDTWVNMLVEVYRGREGEAFVQCQARVVDMVLTQPVVYEFGMLKARTLLLIGTKDTTAIGKQWSPLEVQERLGHYDVLGREALVAISNSTLVEFPDLGHAPQIQAPEKFHRPLLDWLKG